MAEDHVRHSAKVKEGIPLGRPMDGVSQDPICLYLLIPLCQASLGCLVGVAVSLESPVAGALVGILVDRDLLVDAHGPGGIKGADGAVHLAQGHGDVSQGGVMRMVSINIVQDSPSRCCCRHYFAKDGLKCKLQLEKGRSGERAQRESKWIDEEEREKRKRAALNKDIRQGAVNHKVDLPRKDDPT